MLRVSGLLERVHSGREQLPSKALQTRVTQRKQIRMEWGNSFFFFPLCKENFFLVVFQEPRNPRGWVPAGFPVDT